MLVVGFFLYIKLIPFKDKFDDKHLRILTFLKSYFNLCFSFLNLILSLIRLEKELHWI